MAGVKPYLSVDHDAEVADIRLSDNRVEQTQEVNDAVMVDLDDMGVVVGIDILDLAAEIPYDRLVSEYHVYSDVVEALKLIQPSIQGFLLSTGPAGAAYTSSSRTSIGVLEPA